MKDYLGKNIGRIKWISLSILLIQLLGIILSVGMVGFNFFFQEELIEIPEIRKSFLYGLVFTVVTTILIIVQMVFLFNVYRLSRIGEEEPLTEEQWISYFKNLRNYIIMIAVFFIEIICYQIIGFFVF